MEKSEIIENNKRQTASEIDRFTVERYMTFTSYLTEGHKTILDFGCNTGRGGKVIRDFNPDSIIYGADIVRERLELIPDGTYDRVVDLTTESISSVGKVDAIVSGEVVEHIPLPELIDYLSTFRQILNRNGVILITTPNPDSFLVKLGRDSVLRDPSHINIMRHGFLRELLLKTGFGKATVKGSGKATRIFGQNCPILRLYGSYLVIASV
ncbi:MAG: class I SAM-dependent methyltransferase [Rikenellaceae bacterium]|jgi:2-polyprenyl-3-methyl-5-hydroxy-6-metoxy-1,4-benzoquinol methylase|nr:class I SAM-dependent methyltransferase [Rikenellaceae bacterium]